MQIVLYLSNAVIPLIILLIVGYAASLKLPVYDIFIEGAKEGIATVFSILPTLIGLMTAVSMMNASGAFDIIAGIMSPLTEYTGFPSELLPLGLMRLVSSSAAVGMLLDIFAEFGPDSFNGRLASIMMSCTETVFYTVSVYCMSVGVKRTRYTVLGAVAANLAGVIASLYITSAVF